MNKLKALERLENSLAKLPSVGKKSAERMAYAMIDMDEDELLEFSNAVKVLKSSIFVCPICGMIGEDNKCPICEDENRDQSLIMVVSNPKDVFAIEKSEGFNGLYHILGGEISMSKGITTDDLKIKELLARIKNNTVKEVIIATNPTIDGETTALYLAKILAKEGVNVSRLAYGLQMGGNLDYTDQLTLLKALQGRQKI